ncbi:MAG: four-carbon acid sugar kinase family protein [Frankiaceae bacterium]
MVGCRSPEPAQPGGAARPGLDEVLAQAGPPFVVPDARERIRASHAATGRRIGVLDDDPTGSQSVHDVSVVTVANTDALAAALAEPGSTCFILTNSRSMPEVAAVAANRSAAQALFRLGRQLVAPVEVVSRGDSTLRGHIPAEPAALDAVRAEVTGQRFDAIVFVPAYLEAGRVTAGGVHWARVAGAFVPVAETEFARDATFGYTASDLRGFLAEKSSAPNRPRGLEDIATVSLTDVRRGGPGRVAEILGGVTGGRWVTVDAADYADLEVVVLGLLEAQAAGRAFLYRSGPSFVRALAGLEPRPPLTAADIWPLGGPAGHGLGVVGSHVGLTSRQITVALARGRLAAVELDVTLLADPSRRADHVADVATRVRGALTDSDVLLSTTRTLLRGPDAEASLDIARVVSASVSDVVRAVLSVRPAWLVAKGGITAHDVAVRGLGLRRAVVTGQLFAGLVSVFRPVEAAPEVLGVPYVVFAGNVGTEDSLAEVITLLRGRAAGSPR